MLQISQKSSLESLHLESWVCSDFYRLHRIGLLFVNTYLLCVPSLTSAPELKRSCSEPTTAKPVHMPLL